MRIEVSMRGKVCVISPQSDIRMGEGDVELRNKVKELLDQGQRFLVLDLHNVRFMDSAGLGEVVACRKRVTEAQGEMKLAALNQRLNDLFTLTKLHLIFNVHDSIDEAVTSFG